MRQQLLWACRLEHNQREWHSEPLVSKSESLDRFPIDGEEWCGCFGETLYEGEYDDGVHRPGVMETWSSSFGCTDARLRCVACRRAGQQWRQRRRGEGSRSW